MTNYQTEIQNPNAIRWGSAKIEIMNGLDEWLNLGAVKNVSASTNTSGAQKFEPDNAPPIYIDPVPVSWDWTWEMQEAWNADVLQLLRGSIDTYTPSADKTTIGVYAGSGKRPSCSIRITNTTAGSEPAVITLFAAKLTSELDWNFPKDSDGTTSIALPISISAHIVPNAGFGTVEIPTLPAAANNTNTLSLNADNLN